MSAGARARERVADLLEAGSIGEPDARASARALEAIPVAEPADGSLHSWFVPVAVGRKLAGFAELAPDLEPIRYSGFQRRPQDTASLPDLADWTDPDAVRERAIRFCDPDESLSAATLSFDREPARLAWILTATGPGGRERVICVAGAHVYQQADRPQEPGTGAGPGGR